LRLIVLANLFFGNRFCTRNRRLTFLWCDPLVNRFAIVSLVFLHKVVYYEKYGFSTVKVLHVRQPLVKNYSWISTKQLLVFAVTVHYLAGTWF